MTVVRPATLRLAAIVADEDSLDRLGVDLPLTPASTSREALREGLRRAIELGVLPAGVRLRRGNDIAREVGLSRSTVSAAVHDLVQDGLIDRCVGGGAVVRPQWAPLAVRVVPLARELDGALVEEVGILTLVDDDARVRRFTQSLWGRKVAEVRIDCDPRWWTPAAELRWEDLIAPRGGVAEIDVQVTDAGDETPEHRVAVRIEYRGTRGQCVVEMELVKGLFAVEVR